MRAPRARSPEPTFVLCNFFRLLANRRRSFTKIYSLTSEITLSFECKTEVFVLCPLVYCRYKVVCPMTDTT
jgi:hypothetical protein